MDPAFHLQAGYHKIEYEAVERTGFIATFAAVRSTDTNHFGYHPDRKYYQTTGT